MISPERHRNCEVPQHNETTSDIIYTNSGAWWGLRRVCLGTKYYAWEAIVFGLDEFTYLGVTNVFIERRGVWQLLRIMCGTPPHRTGVIQWNHRRKQWHTRAVSPPCWHLLLSSLLAHRTLVPMVTVPMSKGVPSTHHCMTLCWNAHHPKVVETQFLSQRDENGYDIGILIPAVSFRPVLKPRALTHALPLLLCCCNRVGEVCEMYSTGRNTALWLNQNPLIWLNW